MDSRGLAALPAFTHLDPGLPGQRDANPFGPAFPAGLDQHEPAQDSTAMRVAVESSTSAATAARPAACQAARC